MKTEFCWQGPIKRLPQLSANSLGGKRFARFAWSCLVLLLSAGLAAGDELWTLERAISFALTNSPDVVIAKKRIAAARAVVEQANSAVWPKLQFQSSYVRTDNPMLVFGSILNQRAFSPSLNFNDVPDLDDLNVRGGVTQPLYAGGGITAGRRAAKAGVEAAQANAQAVRNALAFETARTFHTLIKTRAFIFAADAGVRAFEHNLITASNRVAAGTALKIDLLDMQVRLAQAREDLVRARNAQELSTEALRNVLGIEQGKLTVAESAPAVGAPGGTDYSKRPELVALTHQQRAAEARVRQARAGYLPRLSAFGNLDYDYGWKTDGDGKSYTAGMMVQWDIWDGKLTRGKIDEAQANLELLQEEERKLRLGIGFEVEQARLKLSEANQRLGVTETAVAQAQESVELTRARFEQGLMLSTQLIDAETALIGARVRRAEAEADQRIAIAALRKAVGMAQVDSSSP